MRGPVYIESEMSWGDRRIVRTVDVEEWLSGTDVMARLREIALAELEKPAVYRVRVRADVRERGDDRLRMLFAITAGDSKVAAMREP
jgi:hypothetical protein